MTLELKHLAPYLPYKLKVKSIDIFENDPTFTMTIKEGGRRNATIDWILREHENFKPILRPISDFYDINAPAFIDTNFDVSTQLVLVELCSKKQHYSGLTYSDMQEFLREHIDVFNIIEKGLAVSIHDVGEVIA